MAPSPALAPQGVPPAADYNVLRRVGTRLNAQHDVLGQVSAELLALGTEVDQAEEQLLGRVLTTQDAKDLVRRHTQLDASNEMSRDSVRRLNAKVDSLGTDLAQAQQALLVAAEAQRAREQRLEEEVAKQQARIASLRIRSTVISNLELNRTELLHTRQELVDNGSRTVRRHDDIKLELSKIRELIKAEIAEEARLRGVLVEVHQYGVMCHSRSKELQTDIASASNQVVTRTAADVATEGHNNAVAKANTQRLGAEGALLRAEVRRVEDSSRAGMMSLTERRDELATLERSIIAEVRNLTERMAAAKERAAKLQVAAQQAVGSEDEHLAETRALEDRIRELSKRISPVVYAALEAENNALGRELGQATGLLMMSAASEAGAFANVQQANAEVEGQRNTAKVAAEAAQNAHEEGQRQLEDAVKEAGGNKAKAEALLARAMSAIEARCKPKWDVRKKEKDLEIEACEKLQEEYDVVSAQEETLKQTLTAQETVEAAVE